MSSSARKPTRTRGQGRASSGGAAPPTPSRPAQRERLITAMIELAAKTGYQAVSVAQISQRAGVSSQTFYEQFRDKEDCLLAAYAAARRRLHIDQQKGCPEHWREAARGSLASLSDHLQEDPEAGSMVFVEALAGEAEMRRRRQRVLAEDEAAVETFLRHQPSTTLDVPVAALEGARRYVISRHLRTHTVDLLPGLVDDLITWIASYEIPAVDTPWSSSKHALMSAADAQRSAHVPEQALAPPPRLPRGRHKLPPAMVARSRRARIIAGTAEVMMAKGYANASVTDIVAAAGIARDVFYEHFENKQHAFLETQQFVTQAVLEICGSTYFRGKSWPQQIWLGLGSLCGLVAAFPALAHVRIVECYAAGPVAVRGTEELLRTAALFLEEGYYYDERGSRMPKVASLAVAGAIFELIYRLVAAGEAEEVPRHLPLFTYLALAPFTGTERAVELVEEFRTGR